MRLADYKKHYKETLRLGGPIMLGQLGVIVVGFVDNIMVGHHGATELARRLSIIFLPWCLSLVWDSLTA